MTFNKKFLMSLTATFTPSNFEVTTTLATFTPSNLEVTTTLASVAVSTTAEVQDDDSESNVVSEEQNLRKMIIGIQKNTTYSAKEKQTMIFALFNNKGKGQFQEYHKDHVCQGCHGSHACNHSHGTTTTTMASTSECTSNSLNNASIGVSTSQNIESARVTVKSLLTTIPVTSSEDKYILSSGGAWIQIPCSQLHPTSQSGTCEHYTRGCSIYTECCRQFFSCRLCHDQVTDHTLDSKDVKVIRCHACSQIQLASNKCTNQMCKATFGEYYCGTCKLWSTGVDIYHCPKCDICLKGKPDVDSKHCDTCGYCMPINHYNDHECYKYGDEICAMCLEDFKGCLGDVEKTKCGHVFHMSCMEKYISHDVCCPICRKTLFDMSHTWEEIDILKATEQIPEDFKDWRIRFQCNDCLAINQDKFSIYGNKCPACASYNTSQKDLLRNENGANVEMDETTEDEVNGLNGFLEEELQSDEDCIHDE